jgi:hypothetical protein
MRLGFAALRVLSRPTLLEATENLADFFRGAEVVEGVVAERMKILC